MDPLNILHPYIFDEILKYLPSRELKKYALVSKKWYDVITTSRVTMKRTYLSIRADWINEGDFKYIELCSNRNLENIIMSDINEIYSDVYEKILVNSHRIWKDVKIFELTLKSGDEFNKLMKTFDSGVKDLTLSTIKIDEMCETFSMDLKNLNSLKISYSDIDLTTSVLKAAPNLTSLELMSSFEYNKDAIVALKGMEKLKKLELRGKWFYKMFKNCHFSEIKFQLEELSISCVDYVMPKKILQNFLHFLENQHGLKKIHLSEWFGLQTLLCAFSMPTLKQLSVFVNPFFRWSIASLPKTNSLEVLDVRTLDVTDELFNLVKMLRAAPNIKIIRLRTINKPLARFIRRKLKNVRTISLVHSNVSVEIKAVLPHVEFI